MNCTVFKALADENRIKIMSMLVENEMCACDISDRLSIGQSTVSHHMKQLVDSSLINMRKDGKWVIYSLNHEVLYNSSDFFIDLISQDVSKVVSCPCDEDLNS